MTELTVTKSNSFIDASHERFTLYEMRILLFAASKYDAAAAARGHEVTLRVAEFAQAWGLDSKTAYAATKEACDVLFEREIRTMRPTKKGHTFLRRRLVTSADYNEGEGQIALKFHDEIAPHLVAMKDGFTQYRLANVANLRSFPAIRLYEIAARHVRDGHFVERIEILREQLGVGALEWRDFQRDVLAPVIVAINAESDLRLSMKPQKGTGEERQRFVAVRFEIERVGVA